MEPMDSAIQNADIHLPAPRWCVADSGIADDAIGAVICIPTFRRPGHLLKTLRSLLAQQTARRFAVVIVENDASKAEGVAVATPFFREGSLQGACIVEPRQGNCHAINAAFETALALFPSASYLLMIDDDEVATPDWLELMLQAAGRSGADVVGGPVWPVFTDAAKQELERHPAFCPAYHESGRVPIIYGSGNCLIRRDVFSRLGWPAFDLRFNFLGGGDLDFFTRCRRAGLEFYWVADAVISETVPDTRTEPRWLAMRGLRIGAINYQVERKVALTAWSRLKLLLKVLAIVPLSLLRAIRLALTERKALIALHPIIVAAGGVLAVFGIEPHQYKAAKIPS
jgi:GT2 family glycosyltransferase